MMVYHNVKCYNGHLGSFGGISNAASCSLEQTAAAAEATLACGRDAQRGHCGAEAASWVSRRRRGQPMTGFNVSPLDG